MKKNIVILIVFFFEISHGYAAIGDYRTRTGVTGNWNATDVWQMYYNPGGGNGWYDVTSYPTNANGAITVLEACNITITADITLDEVNVKGHLTINSGVVVTLEDGTGYEIDVDNTDVIPGYLYVYGTIHCKGTIHKYSNHGYINFYSGSTYKHDVNGGTIGICSWDANSTVEITGITTDTGGPINFDQSFGNLVWNCTGQTAIMNLTYVPTVTGNFTMTSTGTGLLALSTSGSVYMSISGNYTQTGGQFYPSNGSGNDIIYIGGNFNMSSGKLGGPPSGSGSTTLVFNKNGIQTYVYTAGQGSVTYKLNFQVNANSILDAGTSIIGDPLYTTGNFTLNDGAGLKTANSSGITSSGGSGCVQVMGTRIYSAAAHYTFYCNGNQSTGNGLLSPITGSITIGSSANATNLSFTNSTAVNSTLIIINGSVGNANLSYGSSAILEYRGTSAQTTGNYEWPSNTVPNLKINNSSGVTLNSGKTISTNLNLFNGPLSIGSGNTLTLNGTISLSSGSLTGHSDRTSSIIFGGSGSTSLPAILNGLNNLTINRSGATISLTGNVTVYGTMTMTAGSFSLSGGTLSYGSNGTLKYSGIYTTTNNEFPTASGPFNLDVSNNVTLHADRTLNGVFILNSGQFSIGNHTLTLNGSLTKSAGTLLGGSSSNLIVGGTSMTSLDIPAVSLNNLTLNRSSSGLRLIDNITVTGTMTMTGGVVTLNGKTLSYGSSGILKYNGSSAQTTADGEFPATSGPFSLIVDNLSGVSLHADRTVSGDLFLSHGAFSIGSHTLTLNGTLSYNSGELAGGINSNLYIGGSGSSISLKPITLLSLTLNRSSGLDFSGAITVNGTFYLVNGAIRRYGYSMYGPAATLNYNGTTSQTTSDEEFSVIGGPLHIAISNPAGVILHADRTIYGNLQLINGLFSIGAHTLTLNGGVSQIVGGLNGSPVSNLIFGENVVTTGLPAVQLNDLTIDRSVGIFMNGSVTVEGSLNLIHGTFIVNSFTLTMNGPPISGTPSNLLTKSTSGLVFGGNSSGVQIPTSVTKLGFLVIMNPIGVSLESNITISINVHIGSLFYMNDHELYGNGQFNLMPGAKLGIGHPNGVAGNIQMTGLMNLNSGADYEFDGNVNQVTNFLPTTIPNTIRSLYINNDLSSKITLVDDMTLNGILDIQHDGTFFIDPAHTLIVDGDVVIHE